LDPTQNKFEGCSNNKMTRQLSFNEQTKWKRFEAGNVTTSRSLKAGFYEMFEQLKLL
jgi:hypothetical protein